MIDIKNLKCMTDEEIEEDLELRNELIEEIKKVDYIHINGGKSLNETSTLTLLTIYETILYMNSI